MRQHQGHRAARASQRAQQLRLLDVEAIPVATETSAPDWQLDARTRQIGRKGVEAARAALRRAHPLEPGRRSHAA